MTRQREGHDLDGLIRDACPGVPRPMAAHRSDVRIALNWRMAMDRAKRRSFLIGLALGAVSMLLGFAAFKWITFRIGQVIELVVP